MNIKLKNAELLRMIEILSTVGGTEMDTMASFKIHMVLKKLDVYRKDIVSFIDTLQAKYTKMYEEAIASMELSGDNEKDDKNKAFMLDKYTEELKREAYKVEQDNLELDIEKTRFYLSKLPDKTSSEFMAVLDVFFDIVNDITRDQEDKPYTKVEEGEVTVEAIPSEDVEVIEK